MTQRLGFNGHTQTRFPRFRHEETTKRRHYERYMSTIFISYANENESFARLAELMLKEAGYDLWLDDRKLHAVDEWQRAIDDHRSTLV
jgi:hypothetical protein